MLLVKARVRIGQAAQLLERLSNQPPEDDPLETPENCLETADSLWRRLVAIRDESELWKAITIDGIEADDVLERLNDVVFELLVEVTSRSRASSERAD